MCESGTNSGVRIPLCYDEANNSEPDISFDTPVLLEFWWDWFSFSKCQNTKDIYMDDGPSSLKKRKSKFFLIDRRAILDHLTWRHSYSCVSNYLPADGYDCNDVERLRIHLIRLQMNIYDFMTLPSWGDAKIIEEPHRLSASLLEHQPSHTITPTAKDALIPLPTPNEVTAAQPDLRLARKSKGPSHVMVQSASATAEGLNEADITDLCAELEDIIEKDEGTFIRAASVPAPCLGSTIGGFVRKSRAEAMRRQMDPLDSLAHSALSHDVEYDEIPEDDFGTATHKGWDGSHATESNILCKDIFKDPDVCEKDLDQTITPVELRRTDSLLPLELSSRVNVLNALLVSYGYELNSRYTDLVASRVLLQEKLDRKKGNVKLLRSKVTSLDNKLEKVRRDCDALGQENRELQELAGTNAKLTEQALTVRDLPYEVALERCKSQGYKNAVDELKKKVTQFIDSGVEALVRRLLSSDEFHAALVHVASLGINYGVERGLRMG
nr:hypothetical protein [Tanacetum cinerariifolium]